MTEQFYLTPATALQFWEWAKESEFGWVIPVVNPGDKMRLKKYVRMLYNARKNRPDLKSIRVCLPKGGKEIFLVKITVNLDD